MRRGSRKTVPAAVDLDDAHGSRALILPHVEMLVRFMDKVSLPHLWICIA
jgi:hypothetical protein